MRCKYPDNSADGDFVCSAEWEKQVANFMAAGDTTRQIASGWPEWFDLKTLTKYCCASERKIRDWIRLQHDPLPASRDEGKIYISRKDFDSWMERRAIKPKRADVNDTVEKLLREM